MKIHKFVALLTWRILILPLLASAMLISLASAQFIDINQKLEQLDQIEIEIVKADGTVERADDDNVLIGARASLLDLQPKIDEIIKPVQDQLASLNSQLDTLGKEPANGETESPQVAAERKDVKARRQELRIVTTRAKELTQKIDTIFEEIAKQRRKIFTSRLYHRSPVTIDLLASISGDSITTFARFQSKLRTWYAAKVAPNPQPFAIIMAFFVILLAWTIVLSKRAKSYLSSNATRLNALLRPFVSTIVPSGLLALALALGYWAIDFAALFTTELRLFVRTLFVVIFCVSFALRLSHALFAPNNPELRLLPISSFAAKRMQVLVSTLAIVHALDYMARQLGQLVNASLAFTIGNSFLAAVLIALLLLALARVRDEREDQVSRSLPPWVRIPLLLASIAIILAAVAGYIGLARFMAQQLVVTGTILVTTFLGYLLSHEVGKPGVLANTRLGQWMQQRFSMDESDLDQYALFAGIGFFGVVLLAAIPAILLQWGSRIEDLVAWVRQAIIGIQIGSFKFSLASLFFGILIFVLGLVLTRLFQRWLGSAILERTRADNGVKDSIRTGIGYVGIALSVFLGITGAGVDLGSLAIVAGALSLGIGFGLQNVVSNFVSGLIMLVERPIKVGDFVQASGFSGTVSKISVRATEINTIHNQTIIIPNADFINSPVGNWTHKIRSGRVDIPIGVAYGSDLELVRKILLEIAHDHDNVLKRPEPFVFFEGFGDSSINFQLRIHVNDYTIYPRVQTDLLFAIDHAFREAKVEIPFPQRDLNLRTADPNILAQLTGKSPTVRKPRAKPKSDDE